MTLNRRFLEIQLGNRFGEKIKIIHIQPRFCFKTINSFRVRDDMHVI